MRTGIKSSKIIFAFLASFLIFAVKLYSQDYQSDEIIIVRQDINRIDKSADLADAGENLTIFIGQLKTELRNRFPCAKIAEENTIAIKLQLAKEYSIMGEDEQSNIKMSEALKMLNSKYYVSVGMSITPNASLVNTKLLDLSKARTMSNTMSNLDDFSESSVADEIKTICDDIEQSVDLCPWKGKITLTKTYHKDTTIVQRQGVNVPGAPEEGTQIYKDQITSDTKEEYKFKIYSRKISSCDFIYKKVDKGSETSKWQGIRCWAPNGDARYPANSSVICKIENETSGANTVDYAGVFIDNTASSEEFKVNLGIPKQTLKTKMSKHCVIEDDCNPAKNEDQDHSGESFIDLSEKYQLEGLKKGDQTFKGSKKWDEMDGFTIKLEWDLKR